MEYISKRAAAEIVCDAVCGNEKGLCVCTPDRCQQGHMKRLYELPAADVAPVVHEIPILRYRPERYEKYEPCGMNENGETLYLRHVFVDKKSYAMYCPSCGKRLCSRFKNLCPNCGAKMDGGQHEAD